MNEKNAYAKPILLLGNESLAYSVAVCLLKAGHEVSFYTDDVKKAKTAVAQHLSDTGDDDESPAEFIFLQALEFTAIFEAAIVVSKENLEAKRQTVAELENNLPAGAVIAINTESIGLDALQTAALHPDRIIGLNWTEPAHTTRFLEIIKNDCTSDTLYNKIIALSVQWKKDAYTVENYGVRSRLLSAMIREAFYLVENGYASVEDIDRACRNDAGYYLPFAGNCRYMDLMGTYAYGMVMKDLNPDLSTEKKSPPFFKNIVEEGGLGLENGKGFYIYTPEEAACWRNIFREYSYRIEKVMDKYPFNYKQNGTHS